MTTPQEVRELAEKLRTPRITHRQVSADDEPYETVSYTHAVEPQKLREADLLTEYADLLERQAQPLTDEELRKMLPKPDRPNIWGGCHSADQTLNAMRAVAALRRTCIATASGYAIVVHPENTQLLQSLPEGQWVILQRKVK